MIKFSTQIKELLRDYLTYDPDTGNIYRKTDNYCFQYKDRYRKICTVALQKANPQLKIPIYIYSHRLAWFLFYGKWPRKEIDHINLNKLDNRIVNLRLASDHQQKWNRPPYLREGRRSSQFKGVNWKSGKWVARLSAMGIRYHLGSYLDEIDAAEAYDAAARKHHGAFAYLNFPLKY